jgi:methylmalonyl-CoA/ethylmalonyl-CoA epimerase
MGSMPLFKFHHTGVAVADLQEAIARYKLLFGYDVTDGPYDDPIQKVSVCFLSRGTGDPAIELVAPAGADSPVSRILKKSGGAYHVCYQVEDLEAAIEHLTGNGCVLLRAPEPAVAFQMRKIAWLMTGASLLTELVEA